MYNYPLWYVLSLHKIIIKKIKEPTHWKRPWSGKDWSQEEKGMTEDEMVGWHLPIQWTWV